MAKIIGIDLGTTNSVVAIMEGREAKVIVNEEGSRITPERGRLGRQGRGARQWPDRMKRQAVTFNPGEHDLPRKRFVESPVRGGDRGDESARSVQGRAPEQWRGRVRHPRKTVERARGQREGPSKAQEGGGGLPRREGEAGPMITVPAYFNDSQRQATTKDAGRIARARRPSRVRQRADARRRSRMASTRRRTRSSGGLRLRASSIARHLDPREVGDNVVQVISTNGDTHLGGDDIDNLVIDWLIAEFRKSSGIDVSKDKVGHLRRLKESRRRRSRRSSCRACRRPRSTCRS